MRRGALGLLLVGALALAACGSEAPWPADDLLVRVTLDSTSLHPGEGVPLTVTRVWPKSHEPAPWDDALLSPFVLRNERVERREDATRIEETRYYRAYAFSLKDVLIPALVFAARAPGDGAVRIARSEPVAVSLVPVLDPARPGPPERPGQAAPEPSAWGWLLGLLLLVLAFEGAAAHARRERARAQLQRWGEPRRRLRAILDRRSVRPEACRTDLAEAVDVVRAYVELDAGLPAGARTTQEISAALEGTPGIAWRAFVSAAHVDRVKFADRTVSPDELVAALEHALVFVGTQPGGAGA